ncbi:MAG TPA: hypothetical protein VIJ25_20965 [Methylococcales bacterium]
MKSRTPVELLTGVRMGDSRVAACVPKVKNMTGVLHGHPIHSTVIAFRTPAHRSAPRRSEPRSTNANFMQV